MFIYIPYRPHIRHNCTFAAMLVCHIAFELVASHSNLLSRKEGQECLTLTRFMFLVFGWGSRIVWGTCMLTIYTNWFHWLPNNSYLYLFPPIWLYFSLPTVAGQLMDTGLQFHIPPPYPEPAVVTQANGGYILYIYDWDGYVWPRTSVITEWLTGWIPLCATAEVTPLSSSNAKEVQLGENVV